MKKLKDTSPQSFLESIQATDTLSGHDLKRHGELQVKALKWLYRQGYIAVSELTLTNGRRVDCIGYDGQGHIVIVEIKVSLSDFERDSKWKKYLSYCDEFYFLLGFSYYSIDIIEQSRLLKEKRNTLDIVIPSKLTCEAQEREKTIFSINKNLSRKYIYGY